MISKKLFDFISDFSEKQLRQQLDYNRLSHNTTLEEIGIEDLDLDVMMQEFAEEFNIDYSIFDKKLYFGIGIPFIDNNVPLIKKIMGNRKWLPLAEDERKPFTLGNLDSAIETGYLK